MRAAAALRLCIDQRRTHHRRLLAHPRTKTPRVVQQSLNQQQSLLHMMQNATLLESLLACIRQLAHGSEDGLPRPRPPPLLHYSEYYSISPSADRNSQVVNENGGTTSGVSETSPRAFGTILPGSPGVLASVSLPEDSCQHFTAAPSLLPLCSSAGCTLTVIVAGCVPKFVTRRATTLRSSEACALTLTVPATVPPGRVGPPACASVRCCLPASVTLIGSAFGCHVCQHRSNESSAASKAAGSKHAAVLAHVVNHGVRPGRWLEPRGVWQEEDQTLIVWHTQQRSRIS